MSAGRKKNEDFDWRKPRKSRRKHPRRLSSRWPRRNENSLAPDRNREHERRSSPFSLIAPSSFGPAPSTAGEVGMSGRKTGSTSFGNRPSPQAHAARILVTIPGRRSGERTRRKRNLADTVILFRSGEKNRTAPGRCSSTAGSNTR